MFDLFAFAVVSEVFWGDSNCCYSSLDFISAVHVNYRKHRQISRTPSLATQILEKVFHEKNTKEIQSRDYEVFCLHPRQTRQQLIENYFKVLPVILAQVVKILFFAP